MDKLVNCIRGAGKVTKATLVHISIPSLLEKTFPIAPIVSKAGNFQVLEGEWRFITTLQSNPYHVSGVSYVSSLSCPIVPVS